MIDFKKIQEIIKGKEIQKDRPKHVLINLFPVKQDEFEKLSDIILFIMDIQKEKNIPIMTISLGKKDNLNEAKLFEFCPKILIKADDMKSNVTIIGKWYSLMGQLVEELKKLNNDTAQYDTFFTNILINYDPKEEIADSSRLILKKAYLEKIKVDTIDAKTIKEHIYSSYFLPVDLIIESGDKFSGSLLWDSIGSKIFFLNKEPQLITKQDIEKII